ncbi:MAG: hypothetical protein MHM6MM_001467 [Cercozoa sp. M6MM]
MGGDTLPPFLEHLWTMLNDARLSPYISWSDDQTFVISQPKQFEIHVLPRFFKHNKLSSFVRQLNMYQFHKVRDADQLAWRHPYFRRGHRHLLKQIRRKSAGDAKRAKVASIQSTGPPPVSMPPLRPASETAVLRGQVTALEQRVHQLEAHMSHLQSENVRLSNRQAQMANALRKAFGWIVTSVEEQLKIDLHPTRDLAAVFEQLSIEHPMLPPQATSAASAASTSGTQPVFRGGSGGVKRTACAMSPDHRCHVEEVTSSPTREDVIMLPYSNSQPQQQQLQQLQQQQQPQTRQQTRQQQQQHQQQQQQQQREKQQLASPQPPMSMLHGMPTLPQIPSMQNNQVIPYTPVSHVDYGIGVPGNSGAAALQPPTKRSKHQTSGDPETAPATAPGTVLGSPSQSGPLFDTVIDADPLFRGPGDADDLILGSPVFPADDLGPPPLFAASSIGAQNGNDLFPNSSSNSSSVSRDDGGAASGGMNDDYFKFGDVR